MPEAKCGFDGDPRGPAPRLLVLLGPTLVVNIGFDPNYDSQTSGGAPPVASVHGVHALVDTGAASSCIDSALAATLNLPIIDRKKVSGVGGVHDVNMHLAQIYIPELDITHLGAFAGVELSAGGQSHVALIGRTFLQNVTLTYDGKSGRVTISR